MGDWNEQGSKYLAGLVGKLAESNPELAGFAAKLTTPPDTECPPPTACRKCGGEVEHIWSLGAWRKGECAFCARHDLLEDFKAARAELVRRWVNADVTDKELRDCLESPWPLQVLPSRWLQEGMPEGDWLYLHGEPGVGKTTQVAKLIVELHERTARRIREPTERWEIESLDSAIAGQVTRTPVTYTSEHAMVTSCQVGKGRDVEYWSSRPMLIIDEVCRRSKSHRELEASRYKQPSLTPWASTTLFEIYDARYRSGLPTVLVSKYSPLELLEYEGPWEDEALHSRLLERIGGLEMKWALPFEGTPNYRVA